MTIVPAAFPEQAESALASYSYINIAEGTGLQSFWGIGGDDSSYSLIGDNSSYSNEIEYNATGTGPHIVTFNSSVFNLPRTIKGTAYFAAGAVLGSASAGQLWFQISKWDGATQTNITTSGALTMPISILKQIYYPITCTQTHIKKGESLRLVVGMVQDTADQVFLGIDPVNRDGTVLSTTSGASTFLRLDVPFRIDL